MAKLIGTGVKGTVSSEVYDAPTLKRVDSLLPTILSDGAGAQFSSGSGLWSVYYALSCVPQAIAIVGGQYFQVRAGALRPSASERDKRFIIGRMLFYNQIYVLVLLVALFWVDLIPWFGSSSSLAEFSSGAAFSFQCSMLGPSGVNPANGDPSTCPKYAPLYAAGFLGAYVFMLVAQALLTRDSAVFNTIMILVSNTVISLFWLIPGVNPDAADTPAWSVMTSLVISLAGVVIWKRWEMRTPAEQQFTLRSLAEELEEEDAKDHGSASSSRDATYSGGGVMESGGIEVGFPVKVVNDEDDSEDTAEDALLRSDSLGPLRAGRLAMVGDDGMSLTAPHR